MTTTTQTDSGWREVSKREPCAICGKDHWCARGERYWNCMRIAGGKPCANGGWLYPIEGAQKRTVFRPKVEAPTIHCYDYLNRWKCSPGPTWDRLASALGLSAFALQCLETTWATEYHAWAWPMFDAYRNAVGIRLRDDNGRKWAVKGSRQGLFLPAIEPQETAYVCEGPTDTAAALSMGLFAVGRPSCLGCENEIVRLFRRLDVRKVVIISDNDEPGWNGARKLAAMLPMPSLILLPPAKDIREFYQQGGTREDLQALADNMVWNVPRRTP